MNPANKSLEQTQAQYQLLMSNLNEHIVQADELREELWHTLNASIQQLNRHLNIDPVKPSSSYWKMYGEYWKAFQLFRERMVQVLAQLTYEHTFPDRLNDPTSPEDWDDKLEQLEDEIQIYEFLKPQRADLIAFIELIDSTNRLKQFIYPKPPGDAGRPFVSALQEVRSSVNQTGIRMHQTLANLGVTALSLNIGDYPPPETTRIVASQDKTDSDQVIIAEIVLPGYMWKDKLLRKADVIVVSQQEKL